MVVLNCFITEKTDLISLREIKKIFEPYINEEGLYSDKVSFIRIHNFTPNQFSFIISNIEECIVVVYSKYEDIDLLLKDVSTHIIVKENFIINVNKKVIDIFYRNEIVKKYNFPLIWYMSKNIADKTKIDELLNEAKKYISDAITHTLPDSELDLILNIENKKIINGKHNNRFIWKSNNC